MILSSLHKLSEASRALAGAVSVALLLAAAPASAVVVPFQHIWQHRNCSENHSAEVTLRRPGWFELEVVHTDITVGKLTVRELSKPEDENLVWQWHHPAHWGTSGSNQYKTRSPQLSAGRYKVHWEETGHSAFCYTFLALRG
jgi:hypothetical protein